MAGIRINTGVIRLTIDDDPERVIAFNPEDIGFADAFYKLYSDLGQKQTEFDERAKAIADDTRPDNAGVPENFDSHIALMRELIQYVRDGIDSVFGAGTSQTAFGDVYSFTALESFFEGVTPYIEKVRKAKIDAHLAKRKK